MTEPNPPQPEEDEDLSITAAEVDAIFLRELIRTSIDTAAKAEARGDHASARAIWLTVLAAWAGDLKPFQRMVAQYELADAGPRH
jgi:hypothetical protein